MEKEDKDQISLEAFFLRPYTPEHELSNVLVNINSKKRKREEVQDIEMDLNENGDESDVDGVTSMLKNYRIVTYITRQDNNSFERIRGTHLNLIFIYLSPKSFK